MLYPIKMAKVRMVGLSKDLQAALSLWRRLGMVELEATEHGPLGLEKGQTLEIYDQISEQLVRVRGIKNALPPIESSPVQIKNPVDEARKITIGPRILEILAELKQLKKSHEPLEAQRKALERLLPLQVDFSKKPEQIRFTLISCKKKSLDEIKKSAARLTKATKWLDAQDPQDSNSSLALIASPAGLDLSQALGAAQIIAIPQIKGTPRQALFDAQASLERLKMRTEELNFELNSLSEHYYPRLLAIEEALSMDADLAREASKFANSAQCFFASGWIKERDFEKFKNTTEKLLEGQVAIQKVPQAEHHSKGAPTVLENPGPAKPFQFLVEFLSIPNASELDPSIFILFTIPIAYGLIIGDAGYAVISFLIATLISMKVKKGGMMYNFARIWQIGAIPSFIFGAMFDEYFGFSHQALLGASLYTPLIHRVSNIEGLLLLTIGVGWANIALGFILGAINEWHHSKKHAVAKIAWIVVQIGGTIAVACFLLNAVPFEQGIIGAALLGVGIIALAALEGPIGLVEVPGLAANIMSFVRIAAVGVAGVILAEAINSLLMPNMQMLSSPLGIILFIIMALAYAFAHAANAFIAMFEGFIHGARLSVVEFFQKFFHGGGKPFNPFMLKRRYTLDSVQPQES
ncbi:MAG: V-type ATPase 116kDa subunit family protein [Candidatus Micrarchaeota archaeon]